MRAAWLGGSTAFGIATATSDLDITVLLAGPPAPYRESLHHERRPVDLFVQTETSMEHFCAEERDARRPIALRLIGQAHILSTPAVAANACGTGARGSSPLDRSR
ncbi:nucleotidyltransferase domain-containing protein [Nocardia sp. NBC_01730]|uniref:nucleotidyltransferase domain-containing protein n=1 Tax=Nocardia sp. NBC_01730 TaxID=2975998 RepID=UPI002E0E5F68|nr:nucleotidyltransferase domain-containing protein [Nocardia sp. NBC_01730]